MDHLFHYGNLQSANVIASQRHLTVQPQLNMAGGFEEEEENNQNEFQDEEEKVQTVSFAGNQKKKKEVKFNIEVEDDDEKESDLTQKMKKMNIMSNKPINASRSNFKSHTSKQHNMPIEEDSEEDQMSVESEEDENIPSQQQLQEFQLKKRITKTIEQFKQPQQTPVIPPDPKLQKQQILQKHPYRHLQFSPNFNEQAFKRHLILTYRGLVYAKKCLKGPSDKFILTKQVQITEPKVKKFKTLVLDLDETLIHTCTVKENPEKLLKVSNEFGQETTLGVNIRPYCLEFIETMSQYYEIIVFTAATFSYANTIIRHLDPQTKYITHILTRQNCMETKNGFFIKDLRILKDRQLKNIVIVDNLAHSFGFQIENGIPIIEWHNDRKDDELKFLQDYLIELNFQDDVREYNKKKLKLLDLAEKTPDELNIY